MHTDILFKEAVKKMIILDDIFWSKTTLRTFDDTLVSSLRTMKLAIEA